MLDGAEQDARRGADLQRRRVWGAQLRVLFLDGPQLDDEGVVLGVGDLGRVQLVVEPVVVVQERPQLIGPLGRVAVQAPAERRAARASSCTRSARWPTSP